MIVVDREDGRYAYVKVSDSTYAEFKVENNNLVYQGSASYSDPNTNPQYSAPDISRRDSGETIYWSGGRKVAGVTKEGNPVVYVDINQKPISLENPVNSNNTLPGLVVKYTLPDGSVITMGPEDKLVVVFDIVPQSQNNTDAQSDPYTYVHKEQYEVGYTKADEETLKRMYVDAYRYIEGYKVVGNSFLKGVPFLKDVGVNFIGNLALIRKGISEGKGSYVVEGTVGAGMEFLNAYVSSNVGAITAKAGSSFIKVGADAAKSMGLKYGIIEGAKSAGQVIYKGVDEYNVVKSLFKPETTHLQIGKAAIPIERVYQAGAGVTYVSMGVASVGGATQKTASDVITDVAIEQALYRTSKVVPQVRAVSLGFIGAPLEEFSQEKIDDLLEKPLLKGGKAPPISLSLPKNDYRDYVEIKGDGVKGFVTPLGVGLYNINIIERERIDTPYGERTFLRGVGSVDTPLGVGVGFVRGEIVRNDVGELYSSIQGNLYLNGQYFNSVSATNNITFPEIKTSESKTVERFLNMPTVKMPYSAVEKGDPFSSLGSDGNSGIGNNGVSINNGGAGVLMLTKQKNDPIEKQIALSKSDLSLKPVVDLKINQNIGVDVASKSSSKSSLKEIYRMKEMGIMQNRQQLETLFRSAYVFRQSNVGSTMQEKGEIAIVRRLDRNFVLGSVNRFLSSFTLIKFGEKLGGGGGGLFKGFDRMFVKDKLKLW